MSWKLTRFVLTIVKVDRSLDTIPHKGRKKWESFRDNFLVFYPSSKPGFLLENEKMTNRIKILTCLTIYHTTRPELC
jgi:hypothetical protein